MIRLFTPVLAASFALATCAANAGGPVILEEGAPEVIVDRPASTVGLLPLLLIPIILCVALCGGDDEDPVEEPVKIPATE